MDNTLLDYSRLGLVQIDYFQHFFKDQRLGTLNAIQREIGERRPVAIPNIFRTRTGPIHQPKCKSESNELRGTPMKSHRDLHGACCWDLNGLVYGEEKRL